MQIESMFRVKLYWLKNAGWALSHAPSPPLPFPSPIFIPQPTTKPLRTKPNLREVKLGQTFWEIEGTEDRRCWVTLAN